jgi:Acetyltransferase (isoleucine patch superfamily)
MNKEFLKKLNSGELYHCNDETMFLYQAKLIELQQFYNTIPSHNLEKRAETLGKIFKSVGKCCYVEQPFHANWGCHTSIGDYFYSNFNLTLVDDADIVIGNNVMIAPNVVLATAGHPVAPELRDKGYQFSLPITIEDGVWLGANVTVLPGITIGENSVIGAGSVVTHDIPKNVVAVGNPCRVLREISERDREYYRKDRKIDINLL